MSEWFSSIGPVMQMAYVPQDFDAAISFWTKTMGVGPFFYMPDSGLQNTRYKGEPTDISFGLALAYWGDLQIEIIKPNNDAPSMFTDWLRDGKSGVHHICVLTHDMKRAREICKAADAFILQESKLPSGGSVIYVDTGGGDGTILELLEMPPENLQGFEMFKDASKDWDGSEPFRPLG